MGGQHPKCRQEALENERNNESEHIRSELRFRKLVTSMTSTKNNIPIMEKARKMKLYLHVTVWKKMEVIGKWTF